MLVQDVLASPGAMVDKVLYINSEIADYGPHTRLSIAHTGQKPKAGGDCGTDAIAGLMHSMHGVQCTSRSVRAVLSHLLRHGLGAHDDPSIAKELGYLDGQHFTDQPLLTDTTFFALSLHAAYPSRKPFQAILGGLEGLEGIEEGPQRALENQAVERHALQHLVEAIKYSEEDVEFPLYCDALACVAAYRSMCRDHLVVPIPITVIRAEEYWDLYLQELSRTDCVYLLHQADHFLLVFNETVRTVIIAYIYALCPFSHNRVLVIVLSCLYLPTRPLY